MTWANLFSVALRALWRNKSRSILTMLGVIIGVGAVIMLVAIGNGLQAFIVNQFEAFGSNNIFIATGDILGEEGGGGGFSDQSVSSLTQSVLEYDDLRAIRRLPSIRETSGFSFGTARVAYRNTSKQLTIAGASDTYAQITNTKAIKGRFFNRSESEGGEKVAFLGFKVADDLFGNVDPLGKRITINAQNFRVIGVGEEKGGGFGGPSFDDYIYIPLQTWFQSFDMTTVMRIFAKANSTDSINKGIEEIEEYYIRQRGLEQDEFSVFEQSEILDIINQILGVLTAALGGIAAISLLVGGIGIMNIMLVSVTERTREIGLRKAMGATPRVILWQFLIEAVVLSVTGGLIGVGFAQLGSLAIQQFIPAQVTLPAILLAFGVSAAVGIVFGVYPASKAAKLSPIEALRYE